MKPLQVVIADDEFLARENLRGLLAVHPEVRVAGEAGTVAEARRVLCELRPDAVFLDIQMPGGTGFDVLSGLGIPVKVVFVTAYDRFAIRAFRVNAIDYLLKPIDRKLLAGAVQRPHGRPGDRFKGEKGAKPARRSLSTMDDEVLVQQRGRHCLIPLKNALGDRGLPELHRGRGHARPNPSFSPFHQGMGRASPLFPLFYSWTRSLIINTHAVSQWRSHGRNIDLTFQHGEGNACPRPHRLGKIQTVH